jgi:hypothetical protein
MIHLQGQSNVRTIYKLTDYLTSFTLVSASGVGSRKREYCDAIGSHEYLILGS